MILRCGVWASPWVGSNLVCVWVSWLSRQGASCGCGTSERQHKVRPIAHTAV